MQPDLERKLIERFFIKEKKERFLNFIEKEKTRKKFLDKLYHFKDLNLKLFEKIQGNQNEREIIEKKINNKKNITSCYVISSDPNFDGKTFSIAEAIEKIVGIEGTILIFGDADVIYYEAESLEGRFISL